MVAPLVEALLLRAVRRRPAGSHAPAHRPTRLVSRPQVVDSVAYVADATSVLVRHAGGEVEVLPAGSLVLPTLLGLSAPAYVVVTHEPVEVWLRIGPFDTRDDRVVQQVELRLTVTLGTSTSALRDLVDDAGPAADDDTGLAGLGDALLDRLGREVATRTTDALRRRTLAELTDLSLGVLLDGALPATFLNGLVERSRLEVVDVDWPTEGRGWVPAPAPAAGTLAVGPGPRPPR